MRASNLFCRTPSVIARELNRPLNRVVYILNTRDYIRPIGRAGRIRVYNAEAVSQVRHELNKIEARRAAYE